MENDQVSLIAADLPRYRRGKLLQVWDLIEAMWAWLTDPKAPIWGKAIIVACLLYVICPLDLIPDVIPGVGLSDDLAVVLAAACKLGPELNRYKRKR